MTYLFGTYNDMPLKQNPETITLQSCLCESTAQSNNNELPESRGTVVTCMPAHHDVTLPLPLGGLSLDLQR
ncbi:hypothetical protein T11_15169 [Trichinella zimbabwensis]|uniref:Uncharacterized protein n=1 Tax=Trichinella zimbabwensis TaxID=268475 RepID=A0A0V1I3B0_9BILA|nr:hypothetical protein T11_15169 [Trichinella zimbabwensis]